MPNESVEPWKRLSSRVVFETPWFIVKDDLVELPTKDRKVIPYTFVARKPSVLIVPLLYDDEQTVLVSQYRYPIRRVALEFPAGAIEEHETPGEAAKRELVEEIGLLPGHLSGLGTFYTSNSMTDEMIIVFLARELQQVGNNREVTEIMEQTFIPFREVEKLILDGHIVDGPTIIGYYLASKAIINDARI